eukprot:gene28139-33980_t
MGATNSRCLTDFNALMKRYSLFVHELSSLIDLNTPPELTVKLEELRVAIRVARTDYWYYPDVKKVDDVNAKFDALKRTIITRDFIPEARMREFVELAVELGEETIKLDRLYKEERNGAALLGGAAGFFDYFLSDILLSDLAFLRETFCRLEGFANVAKTYAAAKMFAISAISNGLVFIGFSPAIAAVVAPVVLSALIATVVVTITFHVWPAACRDAFSAIWYVLVSIGLAPARAAAVQPLPLLAMPLLAPLHV